MWLRKSTWLKKEKLDFSVDNDVKITTAKTTYNEAYCIDLDSKLNLKFAKKSFSYSSLD